MHRHCKNAIAGFLFSTVTFSTGSVKSDQEHQYVADIVLVINNCGVLGSDLLDGYVVAIADRAAEYLDERLHEKTVDQKRKAIIKIMIPMIDESVIDGKESYCDRYAAVRETHEVDLLLPEIVDAARGRIHNNGVMSTLLWFFNIFIDFVNHATGIDFEKSTEKRNRKIPEKEKLMELMFEHALVSVKMLNFGLSRME